MNVARSRVTQADVYSRPLIIARFPRSNAVAENPRDCVLRGLKQDDTSYVFLQRSSQRI